jgi:hypothetical protein
MLADVVAPLGGDGGVVLENPRDALPQLRDLLRVRLRLLTGELLEGFGDVLDAHPLAVDRRLREVEALGCELLGGGVDHRHVAAELLHEIAHLGAEVQAVLDDPHLDRVLVARDVDQEGSFLVLGSGAPSGDRDRRAHQLLRRLYGNVGGGEVLGRGRERHDEGVAVVLRKGVEGLAQRGLRVVRGVLAGALRAGSRQQGAREEHGGDSSEVSAHLLLSFV